MKETIQKHFQGNYRTYYEKNLPDIKRAGGDEYKARCPFPNHEDKNASFNFNNLTGQYYCHGCGKKGDALHFYAKINSLDTKRDFGKILRGIASDFGIPWVEQKPHIETTYDYVDAEGQLLHQTVRMTPKDFQQRRPGNNGKQWEWNLKGIQCVLYNLPEVKKATEVLILEGEKDCDNLAKLGFTTTTCAMGAKSWKPEYNESLKGKDVVLIPDNDIPGREHIAKIGTSLKGMVKSLKLLELPDLPSKGDVSDFIGIFKGDENEAAIQISKLIEDASAYEPPKKRSLEDVICNASDFVSIELPEKRIFLNPWLRENSIALLSGTAGVGKTFLALGILDAVANGKSFGPWKAETAAPCLFLDGEMPPQDIQERIKSLNIDTSNLFVYCDALANQWGLPRANLASDAWRTKMKSILITRKIKLWVIDNLASLAAGLDENKKQDWDPVNQWLLELRFAGIATIMLHHLSKDGKQRGTSAREDNLDISLMLKPPSSYVPEDGARFIVHFRKARVSTKDLQLISDTEFKLIEENEKYTWQWGSVKKETRKAVLELLDENMDTKSICETLVISKGRVSQIKNQAIKDGYLSNKGKLTQSGFGVIHEL